MTSKKVMLKQIGKIVTGKTPATDNLNFWDGEILFISPTDLHVNMWVKDTQRKITERGLNSIRANAISGLSILVGCIGWDMGNVAIVNGVCATNQQINSITEIKTELVNPYYVYYWLKNKKDYLFKISNVTRTPILKKSLFEEVEINLPDKQYQDRVVRLLKNIDNTIENNIAIIDKLRLVVKTIYDYWFLQFEFPNEEGKPYKSSGGKMVWNEELQREIPEGWKVGNLSNNELTKIIKPGIDKFEGTKNYLETADATESNYTKGEEVTFENRASRANMQPTKNSVWFAKMKDSVKHLLINEEMQPLIERSIFSTGFLGLQCSSDSFEYIATYIKSEYFEKAKNKLAHGATQQAINNSDLRGIKIVIPCDEVLTEFHKRFKSIYSLISKKTIENKELIDMKDFLLPLLMNGQVTISKN